MHIAPHIEGTTKRLARPMAGLPKVSVRSSVMKAAWALKRENSAAIAAWDAGLAAELLYRSKFIESAQTPEERQSRINRVTLGFIQFQRGQRPEALSLGDAMRTAWAGHRASNSASDPSAFDARMIDEIGAANNE